MIGTGMANVVVVVCGLPTIELLSKVFVFI